MLPPVVVEIRQAHDFLQYVLEHLAPPSTLVVCSSTADFFEALQPVNTSNGSGDGDYEAEDEQSMREASAAGQSKHFAPTLRLLSTSRSVKVAFCPDVTHLRAYLASLTTDSSSGIIKEGDSGEACRTAVPILAILNPIELHRPTSAFSAQGLNRTFSIAVEAAHRNRQRLVMADTNSEAWTEELSILNVANKRLGDLAVGRTVTAKAVAERWCTFEKHIPLEL